MLLSTCKIVKKHLKMREMRGNIGFFLYLCAVVLYANGIFVFRYDKDGDISDGDDMRR